MPIHFKDPKITPTAMPEPYEVRDVKITVTSQIADHAYIKSYPIVNTLAYYEVPVYRMLLEGIDENKIQQKFEYHIIRFGVAWKKTNEAIYIC